LHERPSEEASRALGHLRVPSLEDQSTPIKVAHDHGIQRESRMREARGPDGAATQGLLQLGEELLGEVLVLCGGEDVARAACSCTTLAAAARQNKLWHALFQRELKQSGTREELRSILPRGAAASEDCCWRWRWLRLRRLCAMDCLRWSACSTSGQAPRSREGHAASCICDGRFVVLLGGFRPPPLDVHMFDSHAAEDENAWSGPVPMWAQDKDGSRTRVQDLQDAQLAGAFNRPHLLFADPPARFSCAGCTTPGGEVLTAREGATAVSSLG